MGADIPEGAYDKLAGTDNREDKPDRRDDEKDRFLGLLKRWLR
jgi:hypothetical protein